MSLKDFQIISRLGDGSYSSVWKVKRLSDGQEYAMKKVKLAALSDKEKENALNEVRILASIDDPYIIGYKESFFEDNSMTLCIVMEYAGGGDVYNKIIQHQKKGTYFPEEEIWAMFIQMIKGLKTLHDMKILHRDLKCANVFIGTDGKTVKLGDLNVSKVAKGNLAYTQTGTPYYASPEVWKDKPYDAKSDIWSLGCVLYEITTLKPPFRANDMEGLYKKVQRGIFDRLPAQYSIDLYNVICQCLQVSPVMRPNCDGLLNNPIVIKHSNGLITQTLQNLPEGKGELLKTIKMPKNPKTLGQQLPKANYKSGSNSRDSIDSNREKNGKIEDIIDTLGLNYYNGKRAISQQMPIINNNNNNGGIQIRPTQSRESRIQQINRIHEKESDIQYIERMQKEFIDKAKIIRNIPSSKNIIGDIPSKDKYAINNYAKREQISTPLEKISKQDELIYKYQNRALELADRLNKDPSYQHLLDADKDNVNKKANYLIQKYQQQQQQQAPQKGYNQPLQPVVLNNKGYRLPTPQNENPKELIEKYNNIYNVKNKYDNNTPEYMKKPYDKGVISSPYMKKVEVPLGYGANCNSQGGLAKQGAIYQNNYNHLKVQPVIQKANKPAWWGQQFKE